MFYTIKLFLKFIRKLYKVTLCEWVWTVLLVLILFTVWNKDVETNCVEKKSYLKNPIILWWTRGFPGTTETKYCPGNIKCDIYSNKNISEKFYIDAYLFYGSNIDFKSLPLPRKQNETIWGLYHEESPRNVEELLHESVLSLFNFSTTYSRYSDVPFPLQHLLSFEDITDNEYFMKTEDKNKFLNDIAPILYLQSDCETSTERDAYVKELMKYIKVDSYGKCLNNKKLPRKFTEDYLNNLDEDDFLKFTARYKFVIAIENGICEDYITEKFWRAIKVGSVPIYFGSPSIRDWLPNNKSAILLQDFPSPKIMVEHIKKLLENDSLYEEHLEHKTKQVITNQRLIEEYTQRPYQLDALETVERFECFVCKQLHDRKKGVKETNVVDKRHYNCPKPISALSLKANPSNIWVQGWRSSRMRSEQIQRKIMTEI
ncbi:hypothetical protein K1T71_007386 [Dendrolimus kikuchii]|uniref:Uncharacterized protein n=1 Tax=Dendrolimus kikuchii TaxID=765133 RepID=A0ACC1D0L3_9NEOP|nr:hypothetical protein K1T71_007386 [Dendrolimus kikuchii]